MSSIITSNIDETYPVPGQDNNSQGFRDNFNNIKIGLAQAKAEIEALETNAARLNSNNDFNGFLLSNAKTNQFWGSYVNKGDNSASVTISVEDADFQRVSFVSNPTNAITFRNWPASNLYAKIRLALSGDTNNAYTITFATEGGGTIKKSTTFPVPFTLSTGGETRVIEAWTNDGGLTVYLDYVAEFSL
jgi:hypothetical protein